jgi:hypothetical protein
MVPEIPDLPDTTIVETERSLARLLQQKHVAEYANLLPAYIQRLREEQDLARLNALVLRINRAQLPWRAALVPLLSGLKQSLSPL